MKTQKIPFRSMLFVCTHQREGEAACANPERGSAAGDKLVEILREEVKRQNLKGKVRVVKSGCFDVCAQGPNVIVVDPQGQTHWHAQVTVEDLPQLIQKYFSPS